MEKADNEKSGADHSMQYVEACGYGNVELSTPSEVVNDVS